MSESIHKISLKEWVIIHLCYRDVFNAAVSANELASWLGLSVNDKPLHRVLDELLAEGLLETDNQGIFCLRGKMQSIFQRPIKQRLTQIMLLKTKHLRLLRFVPFIWYVGISGSVAANNPTMSVYGSEKGKVDLDIFIVTAPYSFWLVSFFVRLLINIYPQKFHLLCFNYSIDASNLQIDNRNFYTATEIWNLKPVLNRNETFSRFVTHNSWASKYYPDLSLFKNKSDKHVAYKLFKPFNFFFYIMFQLSRCLKHFSLAPILEFVRKNSFEKIIGLYELKSGVGYEDEIIKKFSETVLKYFPEKFDNTLIQFLFPESSRDIQRINAEQYKHGFRKYA
jgi:hypothetical protein